ncbi:hypothetical protein [Chlamydiifrater volucris]|uniref:hypothetical protein n=1 Tax=Chlamydiifrater volucris TaxID=2681470 RepID=UPI0032B15A0B
MSSIQHLRNPSIPENNQKNESSPVEKSITHQRILSITTIALAVLVGAATVAASAILCPTTPFIILTLAVVSSLITITLVCSVLDHQRRSYVPIEPQKPVEEPKAVPIKQTEEEVRKPVLPEMRVIPVPEAEVEEEPERFKLPEKLRVVSEESEAAKIKSEEGPEVIHPVVIKLPTGGEPRFDYTTIQELLNTGWTLELTEQDVLYKSSQNKNLQLLTKISSVHDPRATYETPEQIRELQNFVVWVQETRATPNLGRGSKDVSPEFPKNMDAIRIPVKMKETVSELCTATLKSPWLTSGQTVSLPYVDISPSLPGPKAMTFTRFVKTPESLSEVETSSSLYTSQYKSIIEKSLQALSSDDETESGRKRTIRLPVMGLPSPGDPIYRDEKTVEAISFMTRIALLKALSELLKSPESLLNQTTQKCIVCIELCDEDNLPLGEVNEGSPSSPSEESWTEVKVVTQPIS